jgi:hypothetical protein
MTGAGAPDAMPIKDHQPRALDAAAQDAARERSAAARADRLAERALPVGGGPSDLIAIQHSATVHGEARLWRSFR